MSELNNKETLRPYSMAGSETTTVAHSVEPSVFEKKEMTPSAAPSSTSVREPSAEPQTAEANEELDEKTPKEAVEGSISDEEAEDNFEYPKSWKLAIITIALALSVFCMALVRHTIPVLTTRKLTTLTGQHHHRDCYP